LQFLNIYVRFCYSRITVQIKPGNCESGDKVRNKPEFIELMGFYKFELNAGNIADVSGIPGSDRYAVVIERNGFPSGYTIPAPPGRMPAYKLCIVDLLTTDETKTFNKKKCILNYHAISDPWDVDNNGINVYALSQVTNEQVIVVDDYCIVAGTDTNFPYVNQFNLDLEDTTLVPDSQEVQDARFMIVCFIEPIFNLEYGLLDEMMR